MGMLVLAVLFSLMVGGAVLVLPNLRRERSKYTVGKLGKMWFFLAILATVFVFAVLAVISSYTPVQFGTVAVVTRFGGIVNYDPETGTGKVFEQGINWKWFFIERVQVYSTQKMVYVATDEPQTADYADSSVKATTIDGQDINIPFTVRFRFDLDRIAWVAQNLGSQEQVVERIVRADARNLVPNTAHEFLATELYTGKIVDYEEAVAERLGAIFRANGLILDGFGVRGNPIFDDGYVKTIRDKQIELEKITTADYQAQQAIKKKAQTITEAEAEAESIRKRGEALRENPEILQLELINKLGDKIRVILMPLGQQFILGENVLGDLTSEGESSPGEPTP